jgi:two-component system chemotaxis response regulator CheY
MFDFKTGVLVVDDMPIVRKIMTKVLREIGFTNIVDAVDGAKAWEVVAASTPPLGLILSDWNMPNSTGLDLLKRVRADARLGKTPFVLVTAEAEKGQILEAIQAGVNDYLVKPFTTDSVRAKLEQVHAKLSVR